MALRNWFCKKQVEERKNKYGNRKVNGRFGDFDSKHEENVYLKLWQLVKSGKASDLKRQVSFTIVPAVYQTPDGQYHEGKVKGGKCITLAVKYIADFTYTDSNGDLVVVDAKSDITKRDKVYVIKKKLMLVEHGILIKEM